ncbi:Palmitoyltransferase Hip14, partial [Cladochytrium tenue]
MTLALPTATYHPVLRDDDAIDGNGEPDARDTHTHAHAHAHDSASNKEKPPCPHGCEHHNPRPDKKSKNSSAASIHNADEMADRHSVVSRPETIMDTSGLDIFEAARRGVLERVAHILNVEGISPNCREPDQSTPLHWAANNNHLSIVKVLIEKGAEIDTPGGEFKATPLQWAVRNGNVEVAAFLASRGASLTNREAQGYLALHLAAHGGHTMSLAYLVAAGADIDAPDSMGRTALMWAAYKGGDSTNPVDVLVRLGASVDARDSTGMTALHWAVVTNHLNFAHALVKAGADVDARDPDGKAPADWARERGSLDYYNSIIDSFGKRRGRGKPHSKVTSDRLLYVLPYLLVGAALWSARTLPWYLNVTLVPFLMYTLVAGLVLNVFFGGLLVASTTPLGAGVLHSLVFSVIIFWLYLLP